VISDLRSWFIELMVILVVVGNGYHKWWLLVLSWEAKFTDSFLCGGEFEGVATIMKRSLWIVLCWGFCDVLLVLDVPVWGGVRVSECMWWKLFLW